MDKSKFQEIGFFEYCFESKKCLIFLEKVYTLRSFWFCGTDFHRSIALKCILFARSNLNNVLISIAKKFFP